VIADRKIPLFFYGSHFSRSIRTIGTRRVFLEVFFG
jgi:hypothetical protein